MHHFAVLHLGQTELEQHEFVLKCGIIWPFVATTYEGLHGTVLLNSCI